MGEIRTSYLDMNEEELRTEVKRLRKIVRDLKPYRTELIRLAAEYGDKNDPFALWESLAAHDPVGSGGLVGESERDLSDTAIREVVERAGRGEKLTQAESAAWGGYEVGWADGRRDERAPPKGGENE